MGRLSKVTLLVLLLVQLTISEAALSPYDLTGIAGANPTSDSSGSGGKRVVSTATNSPIYYISKLDLSSIFSNLFPHETKKIGPLLQNRPDLLASSGGGHRQKRPPAHHHAGSATKRPVGATMLPPFKRIPLPFVSNAKPIGSYKLKSTSRATAAPSTTQEAPTTQSTSSWSISQFVTTTDASAPSDITAIVASTSSSIISAATTSTTALWTSTAPQTLSTSTSSYQRYTPSKIIRLKTKFLSNGQPSSVYMFKSPSRRYSLQDILWRPPVDGNSIEQRPQSQSRPAYRRPASFYSKTRRPKFSLFQ